MTRPEYAKQLFYEGYACSQAIVLAFSDLVDCDIEQLKKISLPFGGSSFPVGISPPLGTSITTSGLPSKSLSNNRLALRKSIIVK